MSNTRFIGCLHLGHEWMARRRGFANSQQHDDFLINSYNGIVGKRDNKALSYGLPL
jgi:calcineurin-like phosphoesterase family protein